MKPRGQLLPGAVALIAVLVVAWLAPAPATNPSARLRVTDAAGKPVAGAVVRAVALRTKPGPYEGNACIWPMIPGTPTNRPVVTDAEGSATIAFPKYVEERLETGTVG